MRYKPGENALLISMIRQQGEWESKHLEDIPAIEEKTDRHACKLEDIYNFFLKYNYNDLAIPTIFMNHLSQINRWQLLTTDDKTVNPVIFLGSKTGDDARISIREAEAAVVMMRGSEAWMNRNWEKDQPYMINDVEISTVLPDSNGDSRIVLAHYVTGKNEPRLTHVEISITDDEHEDKFDRFNGRLPYDIPPIIPIPINLDHPSSINTLITPGMISQLSQPHHWALNSFPEGISYHILGETRNVDFSLGIYYERIDDFYSFGITHPESKPYRPWTITFPRLLEKVE